MDAARREDQSMTPSAARRAESSVLDVRVDGRVAHLTMMRPEKRNALNDTLIAAFEAFFAHPPRDVRVVVIAGAGGHFSSGLDLSEHVSRPAIDVMRHSQNWHRVMDMIQLGGLPVISVLEGAVMGGGLELAAATHVRVAEPSSIFQLPEGRRGIFVGGGGSVRIARIIGSGRMVEMMLTGRTYNAEDGLALGLAHYVTRAGAGMAKAQELAATIAENAPFTNSLITQALARIEDMAKADGLFAESLAAALSQTSEDAEEGLRAFLEKRKPKFR
jgi:enoyl-CoA hydratase/carnithine racemase